MSTARSCAIASVTPRGLSRTLASMINASRLLRHVRGNAVGYTALFLALGGTAGAATASYVINSNADVGTAVIAGQRGPSGTNANIIANSIGSGDLADFPVGRRQLAVNAVDSTKIADGAVATGDLAAGAVTTDRLANGAVSATKLGTDVQRRINFNVTPSGPQSNYSVPIGPRLRFEAVCYGGTTDPVVQFLFRNADTTEAPSASWDILHRDTLSTSPQTELGHGPQTTA